MRRECRERFTRHRGWAIPTCTTARASRTCRTEMFFRISCLQASSILSLTGGCDTRKRGAVTRPIFFTIICKRHSIARPLGWGIGCLLWIQRYNGTLLYLVCMFRSGVVGAVDEWFVSSRFGKAYMCQSIYPSRACQVVTNSLSHSYSETCL